VKADAATDKRVTASASSAGEPSAPADAAPTEAAASAAHEFEPYWRGEPAEEEPAFERLPIGNEDTKRIEGLGFVQLKPTIEEGYRPTFELQDMVAYCTAASRLGRGNLVWLSWNPYDTKGNDHNLQRDDINGHDNKTKGAEHSLRLLQHVKPMHFDVWLLQQLRAGEDEPSKLGACYTWPSIGCWQEHESGCEVSLGVRPGQWGHSSIQSGTRKLRNDDYHRALHGFGKNMNPISEVVLPLMHDQLTWKTWAPPNQSPANAGEPSAPALEPPMHSSLSQRGAKRKGPAAAPVLFAPEYNLQMIGGPLRPEAKKFSKRQKRQRRGHVLAAARFRNLVPAMAPH